MSDGGTIRPINEIRKRVGKGLTDGRAEIKRLAQCVNIRENAALLHTILFMMVYDECHFPSLTFSDHLGMLVNLEAIDDAFKISYETDSRSGRCCFVAEVGEINVLQYVTQGLLLYARNNRWLSIAARYDRRQKAKYW